MADAAVKAARWPERKPFKDVPAGAFTLDNRHGDPIETPRWMRLACPRCAQQSLLPIAPNHYSTGETFDWDGNRDAPTLKQRIVCDKRFNGCGWAGHLTAGAFSDG